MASNVSAYTRSRAEYVPEIATKYYSKASMRKLLQPSVEVHGAGMVPRMLPRAEAFTATEIDAKFKSAEAKAALFNSYKAAVADKYLQLGRDIEKYDDLVEDDDGNIKPKKTLQDTIQDDSKKLLQGNQNTFYIGIVGVTTLLVTGAVLVFF